MEKFDNPVMLRGDQGKMEKFDNPVMFSWVEHGLMNAFRAKDIETIKWFNTYWEDVVKWKRNN